MRSAAANTGTDAQPRRPRGRPRKDDLAALEARLIAVASRIFFNNGYGLTTMSAVAIASRVSKTTLYARFPSKADLFRAIVAAQIESWGSGIYHEAAEERDTLAEELLGYGDTVLRAGTSQDFIRLARLLYSESERFPELGEIAHASFQLGVKYLADRISLYAGREGVECRDPAAAAEMFHLMLSGRTSNVMLTGQGMTWAGWRAWLEATVQRFMEGRASW